MQSPRSPSTGDAESLFRSHPISTIRNLESSTRLDITSKSEQLRHLVGASYRHLIDSADSILLIKSTTLQISSSLSNIHTHLHSLQPLHSLTLSTVNANPARSRIFSTAARVKYLVDTPENIWGCLDESMLVESACRYLRASLVHSLISTDPDVINKFPLLRHQWQIVCTFKPQISLRTRERLTEKSLPVTAYADALAAAATIDNLDPRQMLSMFLDSRRSWILQKLENLDVEMVLCGVVRIMTTTIGQVGMLFVPVLTEMPLFYKAVLEAPPGVQLFGGIPNPEEEVRMWKERRERLEGVMVHLEAGEVGEVCLRWLTGCCEEVFGVVGGKRLVDAIGSGEGLGRAERLVREAMDGHEGLEESLEVWMKSVFGSEIVSPWNQLRGLILKEETDVLGEKLEEAFVTRMKEIVESGFDELRNDINVRECIEVIAGGLKDGNDFEAYLKKPSTGGVWFSETAHRKTGFVYSLKPAVDETDFHSCLNAYLGPEVSRIRDAVDNRCKTILDDLLCFVESNNMTLRLKELAPFLQEKCYKTISSILKELEDVLRELSVSLGNIVERKDSSPPSVSVERSLFIGRLLFAFKNHSSHIPLILGSPRQWLDGASAAAFDNQLLASRQSKSAFDSTISFSPRRNSLNSPRRESFNSPRSPKKQYVDTPRRQIVSALAQLFPVDDSVNPKLEELNKSLQELCFRAYSLWITWVSNELSMLLYKNLTKDETLSASTPLRGWGVIVVKQEQSDEGPLEMKISLPCLPSLYITSFLYQACLEIHKAGGHVLDKFVLQYFAWKLLEKVVGIYENFLSALEASEYRVSEKGILQILLDLRFTADILSGGKDSTSNRSEVNSNREPSKIALQKTPFRWRQAQSQSGSASTEPVMALIRRLSQRLDPIDWETYEPYLWENEKQSYKQYAVLFGFLVQLNRVYTDTDVKYKPNMDSNILRCSTVPRFKYLPISAPALSSRGTHKSSLQTPLDDASSRSPWKVHSNGEQSPNLEFDDSPDFGVATPLLKSFMSQVGSKFGESTQRWGSMLSDGQVGKAAMSTFGDMLPGPAAGLLSSLTSVSRFDT